jgi:hypothetical protein
MFEMCVGLHTKFSFFFPFEFSDIDISGHILVKLQNIKFH